MTDRLAAIQARLDAATDGPWQADRWEDFSGKEVDYSVTGETLVADRVEDNRDAEFIAHAPEDIAYLLAEVERLRVENEERFLTTVAVTNNYIDLDRKVRRAEALAEEWEREGVGSHYGAQRDLRAALADDTEGGDK